MKDWRFGASLAVAAGCVGAFGWMLSGIWGVVNQNREELIGIHRDIGRLHANQQRILDAMRWRGGRPMRVRAGAHAIAITGAGGTTGTGNSQSAPPADQEVIMDYVERHGPGTVRAERMPEGVSISHPDGVVIGEPGDWLVTAPSGHRFTLPAAAFHLTYRRADDTDIYTVE